MNKSPHDGDRLAQFLREHRPDVPPPAADLEEQIMAAVESSDLPASDPTESNKEKVISLFPPLKRQKKLWFVPPAIAASLLLSWTGYHLLFPTKTVDTASLESFVESNWDVLVSENYEARDDGSELDWYLPN